MKTAICHDYINKAGGGERTIMEMARTLKADIYTGHIRYDDTYEEMRKLSITEIAKGKNQLGIAKAFDRLQLGKYDIVICSGTWSMPAGRNHPSIWYCHTPARWLYNFGNQRNLLDATGAGMMAAGLPILKAYWKRKDRKYAANFDRILCNSENTLERLHKCYEPYITHKASVAYPPAKMMRWKGNKNYYLSTARIDRMKRVDVIAKAFMQMEERLIITSDGNMRESIYRETEGHPNITLTGKVTEKELEQLTGNCTATIYIPEEEDFGMSPIEGMSAGKPCIGIEEGGLKETITEGKTGTFIKEPTAKEIIKAVKMMTPERCKGMRKECEKKAKEFTPEKFRKKLREATEEAKKSSHEREMQE